MNSLQIEFSTLKTSEFVKDIDFKDARNLANAKSNSLFNLEEYYQVFNSNHGFISNLSILDLIFMEGPNALNYLENQIINF